MAYGGFASVDVYIVMDDLRLVRAPGGGERARHLALDVEGLERAVLK